ncbi:hypothetical protein CONLIGDRAFT_713718 [Coniochaeta ligniaria NRRL 30616]|uniref:F-box domain-containing protein n=1 Tax=Coniochaeta ligniaria NRRL 30616 TaxID=1408157 RepID=A0A1J7IUB7_9PEZI|nr:hypothetical protein CONLIGDRAFT_713718 [Coniochaeta ligniaria NRRL 30616]
MAAGNFLEASNPPELLIRIFEHCLTAGDAGALAATCRYTYAVWKTHASAIISSVWPGVIPAFDEALVAARITQFVVDAEARGDRPPTEVPLHGLSSNGPTIADLSLVHKLHHLASALEVSFCHHEGRWPWPMTFDKEPPEVPPEEPERLAEWRERLHRAIYRTLIAGGALAGVYDEPLARAKAEGLDTKWLNERHHAFRNEEELTFLESYAAYNVASTLEEDEAVFGPFAAWLLQRFLADHARRKEMAQRFESGTGRAELCQQREDCPVRLFTDDTHESHGSAGNDSDAHFVVWQVIQMAWVMEHLEQTVRRCSQERTLGNHLVSQGEHKSDDNSLLRVPVVLLGIFQPEIVTLPNRVDLKDAPLVRADSTQAAAELDDGHLVDDYKPYQKSRDLTVRRLLDCVYWNTYRPNYITGNVEDSSHTRGPVPPLPFKLFQYFLRRYSGLLFAYNAWSDDDPEADTWELFARNFGLFAHDDVEGRDSDVESAFQYADFTDGSEILVSAEPAPVVVHSHFH